MKHTRKIVALLMAVVALLSSLLIWFSCSLMQEDKFTKGEWLASLCDYFGMYGYNQEEPYANTVDEESEYFPYIQMAFEWGMINDKEIDPDDEMTKGFLATTLVKCVGLADTEGMSDEEVAAFAAANKYLSYSYEDEDDFDDEVTPTEADKCLEMAYNIWTDRTLETVENYEVAENVVDLSDGELTEAVAQGQVVIDTVNSTVEMPAEAATGLTEGSVFILPATDENDTASAFKVGAIVVEDGKAYIQTVEPEMEEVLSNLELSGDIESADLDEIEFVDGMGNVIPAVDTEQTGSTANGGAAFLGGLNGSSQTAATAKDRPFNFNMDGLSITGKISGKGVSITIKGEMALGKKTNAKASISKTYSIEDIGIEYDWDVKWVKEKWWKPRKPVIQSAYANVKYTTKDITSAELSWDKKGSFFADQRGNYATSENGFKYWKEWYNKNLKLKADEEGKKTITICSFKLVDYVVARVDLDIKLKVSASGSIELVVETNHKNGLEFKNNKLRYIQSKGKHVEVSLKGQAEFTGYIGFTLKALGMNLLGGGLEGGIGFEASVTAHMLDSHNKRVTEISGGSNAEMINDILSSEQGLSFNIDNAHTGDLHFDVCMEASAYWILRIGVDSDCTVYKILKDLGLKINLEFEIFGSDNAKIWERHYEDWKLVNACTREYEAWEAAHITEATENPDAQITDGSGSDSDEGPSFESSNDEFLDIDTYFINLLVGNSEKIKIAQLPKGYKVSDVKFSSSNTAVATVDANGKITGVGDGIAEIEVSIPGTEYKVTCTVVVSEVGGGSFTGIPSSKT